MNRLAAISAISLAGALLCLQVVLACEYTAGGSLGTQASMVFAMITLALLPVFIEAARRTGHNAVGVALFVAFVAFLAYSLPATTGRTGEIKETKVTAAADVTTWKSELASLYKTADWHRGEKNRECVGAPVPLPPQGWPKCRSHQASVTSYEERIAKLEGKVSSTGSASGDVGSDLWAWATGLPSATVRKVSVLSFAIGMDMAIWALIWLATGLLSAPVQAVTPVTDTLTRVTDPHGQTDFDVSRMAALPPPEMFGPLSEPTTEPPKPGKKRRKRKDKNERATEAIRAYTIKHGRPPAFSVVMSRHKLPKSTASRLRNEVIAELEKVA